MESVTHARTCSERRLMYCQHGLAATTRANHPTQTECQNRRQLWLVVLAQMDIESDGPVLLIVCGYHKARLDRGGSIVAAERLSWEQKEALGDGLSAAWENADDLARSLLLFEKDGPDLSGRLGQLAIQAQGLNSQLDALWKKHRGL